MPVISTPIGILTNVPPFDRCACAILYRDENLIATSLPLSTSRFGQIGSPIRLWQFWCGFDAGGKSREFCSRHLRFPLGLFTYGECNRPRAEGAAVCRICRVFSEIARRGLRDDDWSSSTRMWGGQRLAFVAGHMCGGAAGALTIAACDAGRIASTAASMRTERRCSL